MPFTTGYNPITTKSRKCIHILCSFLVILNISCYSNHNQSFPIEICYSNIDASNNSIVYLPYSEMGTLEGSKLLHGQNSYPIYGAHHIPLVDPKLTDNGDIFFKSLSKTPHISKVCLLSKGKIYDITNSHHGDIYRYSTSSDGSVMAFASFNSDFDTRYQLFYVGKRFDNVFNFIQLNQSELPKLNIDKTDVQICVSPEGIIGIVGIGRLFLVDGINYNNIKYIDTPSPVLHLTMGAGRAVFSSLNSGYFQIFEYNYETNTITQLTTTASNKFKPYLHDDKLFYLDFGDGLFTNSDIKILENINGGLNRRGYTNEWGRLSWSESNHIENFIDLYRKTNDSFYLKEAINMVDSLMLNTDDIRNIYDYRGRKNFNWNTTRYSYDASTPDLNMIDTAQIVTPIAELTEILQKDRFESYSNLYNHRTTAWIEKLLTIPDYFKDDYRSFGHDPWNVTEEGEGYFIIPKGSPSPVDGANVPFNYQNRYGSFLLRLYNLTGRTEFLEQATSLGLLFKRKMSWNSQEDAYLWNYWWSKGENGWGKEDNISIHSPVYPGYKSYASYGYATIDVKFISDLSKIGNSNIYSDDDLFKVYTTNTKSTLMRFDDSSIKAELIRRGILPIQIFTPDPSPTLVMEYKNKIQTIETNVYWYKPFDEDRVAYITRLPGKPYTLNLTQTFK